MVVYIVCMITGIAVVYPVNKAIFPWKNEFQYLCTKQSLRLHKKYRVIMSLCTWVEISFTVIKKRLKISKLFEQN